MTVFFACKFSNHTWIVSVWNELIIIETFYMKNGRRLEVTGAISKVRRKNVITKLTIEIEPPILFCLHLIFMFRLKPR